MDLPKTIRHCQYHLYADDLQIYISANKIELNDLITKINTDLQSIDLWCTNNGLKLNPGKTKAICIGSNKVKKSLNINDIKIKINNHIITLSELVTSLGVVIDEELNFEAHVNKIIKNVYLKLRTIYRLKSGLDVKTKLKLIQTLIYPHFDYCCCVYYYFLNQQNKFRLQRFQNIAIRYVYKITFYDHVTPYFVRAHELKFKERADYLFLILLFKLIHNKHPEYLYKNLILRSDVHAANIRHNTFTVPKHLTSKFEACFSYMGPKLLNSALDVLNRSFIAFKNAVKTNLLSVYGETLD